MSSGVTGDDRAGCGLAEQHPAAQQTCCHIDIAVDAC